MTALRLVLDESPDRFAELVEDQLRVLSAGQFELRKRLDSLRDLLEADGRLMQLMSDAATRPAAPSRLMIDMESVSPFVENLYPCEYLANGTSFRWTGPGERVRLFLFIDRGKPRELKIKVMSAVTEEAKSSAALMVDGEPIEHITREHALLVVLPANDRKTAMTELELSLPGTASPRELDSGNADNRRLGIAISGLEVS